MFLDHSKYMHLLDGYDMTDQQKIEFIEMIQRTMESFVDAAWGMDATQLALGTTYENDPDCASDAIEWTGSATSPFNDAAC